MKANKDLVAFAGSLPRFGTPKGQTNPSEMHVAAFVPSDDSAEVWLKLLGQSVVCEALFMKPWGPARTAEQVNRRLHQDALANASDHTQALHHRSWLKIETGPDMQGPNTLRRSNPRP